MKKRKLGFASLGNGISVYDSLHEKHGDYETVAHISIDRIVTYYVDLEEQLKNEIEEYAARSDRTVSASQDQKVFRVRPSKT